MALDYLTVKEAGEKWGLGTRIVTLYCAGGRIDGAVKKGNLWLVPQGAPKPADKRRKKTPVQEEKKTVMDDKDMDDSYEHRQYMNIRSVQSLYENKELFVKIVKHFPYPMHICEPDGTILYANEAFLKFANVSDPESFYGKHNVLQDPNLDKWGIKEYVLRAYRGEIVQVYDIKVPVQELINMFSSNKELVFESLFHNITSFPICDDNGRLLYLVTVFITSRFYRDKEEIIKGKEYIEDHWKEEFDIDKIVGIVNLSRYHYTRLFKKHTGMTPYGYYQNIKIGKLKEKLCDKNLSIARVFADCGIDYSGNFVRIFKEKVGMTPSQYRRAITQK